MQGIQWVGQIRDLFGLHSRNEWGMAAGVNQAKNRGPELINILEWLATQCCVVVSWKERTRTANHSGKRIFVCNVLVASEAPLWLSG